MIRKSLFANTGLGLATVLALAAFSVFALNATAHSHGVTIAKNTGSTKNGTLGPHSAKPSSLSSRVRDEYGRLPLAFEKNEGQSSPVVQYLAHGNGYELFLTPKQAVLALRRTDGAQPMLPKAGGPAARVRGSEKVSELSMTFDGANEDALISGQDRLARKTNYFVGNDPKNWHTDVPSFSAVRYDNLYKGVDLLFYGNQHRLEYDFQVAPGADPKQIALRLAGAQQLRLDGHGDLLVKIAGGGVELAKPVVYQTRDGQRVDIESTYALASDHSVRFAIGRYDKSEPLIIDPVLNYSTFIGGGSGDLALAVAVDGAGNSFVTGQTFNASFPTGGSTTVGLGTPDGGIGTNGGAFVSEINPSGTTELYFSYLSGDGGEAAGGIAVDPAANRTCMNGVANGFCVYVAGQTFSDNFPLSTGIGPYNSTAPGGPGTGNAFVTKLNPYVSGASSLVYSTYLASSGAGDFADAVAVDTHQHVYVTGEAFSTGGAVPNFPVMNAAQATNNVSGNGNAFLTVINTTTAGTAGLVYSTFLGGGGQNSNSHAFGDAGQGVVVDANGIAYLTGVTTSTDFPSIASTGTYPSIKGYSAFPTGNTEGAAFVSAINTTLSGTSSLLYSTYLGGTATVTPDDAFAIALAGNGVVYVTGDTEAPDFPVSQTGTTVGGFPSPAPTANVTIAFVTKFDTTTTISPPPATPPYSVLLGGNNGEVARGIALDTLGNVVIAGLTASPDFPVTPGAFQTALAASALGDAFVSKLNPAISGSAGLVYSTYFGGSGSSSPDQAFGVALDSLNNAYIAGVANSATNFPIFPANAFENAFPGGSVSAGFVAKLTLIPTVSVSPTSLTFTGGIVGITSVAQTVTLTNNTNTAVTISAAPTIVAGTPAASSTDYATTANACTGSIPAGMTCTVGVTFKPSVTTVETATLQFTDSDSSSPQTVSLTSSGTIAATETVTALPATLTFTSQTINTTSTAQTVTVTNTGNSPVTLGATAVSFTGTNNADFAAASGTTCTNNLVLTTSGASSMCVIKVTFTPAAVGARVGVLNIADNATGSPQMIALTGTGAAASTTTVTVLPAMLTFSSQTVSTASAPQTVTVTNTGSSIITLGATALAISGTNMSDFAVASGTTCTNSLALQTSGASASCVINITFTPGATGARSASLSVTDTATGSPQMVALSGTGAAGTTANFSLTPATQSVSVAPGASGTFSLNVVGTGGFTGAVSFTCSGAPRNATCTAPSAVNASPSPGTAAMFTLSTKAFVAPAEKRNPPISPQQLIYLSAALLSLLLIPSMRRFRTRLGLVGAMAVFVVLAGCAGTPSTPAGSYTLTVTGTSGSLTQTATVSLTVQ